MCLYTIRFVVIVNAHVFSGMNSTIIYTGYEPCLYISCICALFTVAVVVVAIYIYIYIYIYIHIYIYTWVCVCGSMWLLTCSRKVYWCGRVVKCASIHFSVWSCKDTTMFVLTSNHIMGNRYRELLVAGSYVSHHIQMYSITGYYA